MRLGIISDTHGSVAAWEKVMTTIFKEVEIIIHAGDVLYHGPRNPLPGGYDPQKLAALINNSPVPVIIARGNCDAEIDQLLIEWPLQAPYAFLQIENLRFLVTHGHRILPQEMQAQAHRYKVQLFISGHTHLPGITKEKGVIFLNPGSPSLPKNTPARPTAALVDERCVQLIDVETGQNLEEVSI